MSYAVRILIVDCVFPSAVFGQNQLVTFLGVIIGGNRGNDSYFDFRIADSRVDVDEGPVSNQVQCLRRHRFVD